MAHKKAGGSSRNGRDSEVEAPRRQGLRRRSDPRRRHHRPPARHARSTRRQRRHRQGPHAVRAGRRHGRASAPRARRSASSRTSDAEGRRAGRRPGASLPFSRKVPRRVRGFSLRPVLVALDDRASAPLEPPQHRRSRAPMNTRQREHRARTAAASRSARRGCENRRPIRKNASPSIVPAKMRKPTPPARRWKYANGSARIIITTTAAG